MGKTFKDSIYKDKHTHQKKAKGNQKHNWKQDIDIENWDSTRYILKKDNKEFYETAVEGVESSDVDFHHLCRTIVKSKDRMWKKIYTYFTDEINKGNEHINSIFSDILHIIEFTDNEFTSLQYRLQHRRKFKEQQFKIEQKLLGHFVKANTKATKYWIRSYKIQEITGLTFVSKEV